MITETVVPNTAESRVTEIASQGNRTSSSKKGSEAIGSGLRSQLSQHPDFKSSQNEEQKLSGFFEAGEMTQPYSAVHNITDQEEQNLLRAQEAQDEKAYQTQFRKTFVTDLQRKGDDEDAWTLHEMTIPGGN